MTVEIDTTIVDTILNDLSQTKIDNFAPNWINKDFLEKHLQSSFSEKQINIINFEVKPATAKGENYASYLYRVRINYTDELQNCKSGNNLVRNVNQNQFLDRTIFFYYKITNKFQSLLKNFNFNSKKI